MSSFSKFPFLVKHLCLDWRVGRYSFNHHRLKVFATCFYCCQCREYFFDTNTRRLAVAVYKQQIAVQRQWWLALLSEAADTSGLCLGYVWSLHVWDLIGDLESVQPAASETIEQCAPRHHLGNQMRKDWNATAFPLPAGGLQFSSDRDGTCCP